MYNNFKLLIFYKFFERYKQSLEEKYDFYSPSNLKVHELDTAIKDHLVVMDSLDFFTKRHSENVANLVGRICEYMHCNSQFTIHCVIAGYLHDIGKLSFLRK